MPHVDHFAQQDKAKLPKPMGDSFVAHPYHWISTDELMPCRIED